MAKICLVISQFEPFGKFINRLRVSLKKVGVDTSVHTIEGFLLSSFVVNPYSVIVPCTNASEVSYLIKATISLGGQVLNRGIASIGSDRISINTVLARVGVPIPRYWASLNAALLHSSIPKDAYPIIVKSTGLHKQKNIIFADAEAFRHFISSNYQELRSSHSLIYCEQYLNTTESYLKVYVCGSRHAVYRKFQNYHLKPKQENSSLPLRKIIRDVKNNLHLDFFSMDIVNFEENMWVVDVNTYPIFKYHADAYDWLADIIRESMGKQRKRSKFA